MRRLPASVLAVVAAAALTLAQGAVWVRRDLLDSERFAAGARDGLQSQEVRNLIADAITDRALARAPAPVPDEVRDRVAEEIAVTATSDTFGAAFERSVMALHAALLSGAADRVALDLSAAGPSVVEAVRRAEPRLADSVPLEDLSAVDLGAEELPDLSGVRETTDGALRITLLMAAVALAAALMIARDRWRVVVVAGVALALGSLVMGLTAEALIRTLAERVGGASLGDAVGAVLGAMTRGLRLRAWASAALGIASAAVAFARGRARPAIVV